jgi:prophage regulatory protein
MPDTYLADTTLAKRYGISRNSVWRWHRERPDFPRAIKLSTNCTRWKLSEIADWEASQAEMRKSAGE